MKNTANKFNRANAALKGFAIHDGFMGDETLIHLVQDKGFRELSDRLCNESFRAYRDYYLSFERKTEKLLFQKKDLLKAKALYTEWLEKSLHYLGFADFNQATIKHPEEGHIPYWESPQATHSLAVFICNDTHAPASAFETGGWLTDLDGEVLFNSSCKETLCEQVEKSLKETGHSEAILLMPFNFYYFRAESHMTGQCLEANITEIMSAGSDEPLALLSHLFHERFFAFSQTNDEDVPEDDAASASQETIKLTASSQLFKEDLELARQITEQLHQQVTLALEILCNERLAVDSDLLKTALKKKSNHKMSEAVFKDGLFILYRILFILYAESREHDKGKSFLPIKNAQYHSFYSMEHLLSWAEDYLIREKRGTADPEGTYLWGALQSLFVLLRRGVALNGGEVVSPYNGQLFSPEHSQLFAAEPGLRDQAISRMLLALGKVGGADTGRRLNFSSLGIEQLGAVYEAMLAQKPMILMQDHQWVPAHGGGYGLVAVDFAEHMGLQRRKDNEQNKFDDIINLKRPGKIPRKGKFVLASMGGSKRQTAAFYTPPKLAAFLVRRTLKPLVEGKTVEEILNVRLVEPAVGSGGFLIAAARYMAQHLLAAKVKERHEEVRGRKDITARDLQRCKRQIVEQCLYGVDINPLSIQLCRTALYLECLIEGEPLPFLHHHLKAGNSLIGAEFQSRHEVTWQPGFEFSTLFDIPFQQINIDNKLWQAWDDYRRAYGKTANADHLEPIFKQKQAELALEKRGLLVEEWQVWARAKQTQVNCFLQLVKTAHDEFEQIQNNAEVIDRLDDRNKDRLALLPDMDPVLIEAYDMNIDETLERKRKQALITELGKKIYAERVSHQRAYLRLKALGDLNTALWYWPLDQYQHYPRFSVYRELCDWMLNENTLIRGRKGKNLSTAAFKGLKIALGVAKNHQFFHWQVEFAHIFADVKNNRFGFNAVISNPPWKVVGVKDKEVFPEMDPQFMSTAPENKAKRLQTLYELKPSAAKLWLDMFYFNSALSNYWRSGKQSKIKPEGQIDQCVLFTLTSENCVSDKGGRIGLIANRSSLFTNKATKNIRQHFFEKWGLEESISFVNTIGIFEIHSHIEFLCLIGNQGGSKRQPRFIHGVTDPNDLDIIEKNIESKELLTIEKGHKPVELNLDIIEKSFSRDSLSIPGLKDQRQLDVARALHETSGPVVYLGQIDCSVKSGIHQTSGPQKGMSQFAEKIPAHELPTLTDIRSGKKTKWVPLYRGRQFNLFEPMVGGFSEQNFTFNQHGLRERLAGQVDFDKATLVWRAISQKGNQRTLITSFIAKGVWCDNSVWAIQFKSDMDLWRLKFLLSSSAVDFCLRNICSVNVTLETVKCLPLTNYSSEFMIQGIIAIKKMEERGKNLQGMAKIDALVWLHYGINHPVLNRENLAWLVNTQFPTLLRHNPGYADLVLNAYDEYKNLPPNIQANIFSLKPETEVTNNEPAINKKTSNVIPIRKFPSR